MMHSVRLRTLEDRLFGYTALYLPAALAWALAAGPLLSFGIAWMGSWWVLWLSTTGRVRALPDDRSWAEQLFRPLFLSQIMFFVLFCLGPIFQMWDLVASREVLASAEGEIQRVAVAQRYYVLGYAAFVHGMLVLMDYRRSGEWEFRVQVPLPHFFLYGAAGALGLSILFDVIPGLGQFSGKFLRVCVMAIILGFAYSLRGKHLIMILLGGGFYGYVIFTTFLTGWKHQVILVIGLLLFALYPRYKKKVGVAGLIATLFLITVLPAYNSAYRKLNWKQDIEAQEAAQIAFDRISSGRVDLRKEAWEFLSGRLTTVGLFTDYIQNVPDHHPYYGLSTVEQAVYGIVPDVLWPGKPNMEKLVMERVYENTTVRPGGEVSAKPKIVVDGYLAGGWVGIWIACFLLGGVASIASRYAELWFGGYEIGGQLIYPALFGKALFAASFEFLFNSLFWAFVLMVLLFYGLQFVGLLRWSGGKKRGRVGRVETAASQFP